MLYKNSVVHWCIHRCILFTVYVFSSIIFVIVVIQCKLYKNFRNILDNYNLNTVYKYSHLLPTWNILM